MVVSAGLPPQLATWHARPVHVGPVSVPTSGNMTLFESFPDPSPFVDPSVPKSVPPPPHPGAMLMAIASAVATPGKKDRAFIRPPPRQQAWREYPPAAT